jgi:probable F420-dependent oxidoreductase
MKFGVQIMGIRLRHFAEVSQIFEQNGFESIWVPEHIVFPARMPPSYPYTPDHLPPVDPDTPCYDPWALLSYIACATTSIRMATNIYIAPLRHPLQTARSVVTVDRLSGGRVTLGAGVGWLREEFDYLGQPFENRGKRMDEIVPLLRELWSAEVIERHDQHFDFGPVKFNPKPLQSPTIPIELGGNSPAALRRAGRLGDGWIEIGATSLDELGRMLETVMQARREAGREHLPFEVTSMGFTHSLTAYREAAQAGVTRILTHPSFEPGFRPSVNDFDEWAKRFADEIISRL